MNRASTALAIVLAVLSASTGCAAAPKASPPAAPSRAVEAVGASAPALVAPAAPAPPPPARVADAKTASANTKSSGATSRAPVIIYQGDVKMMADEDAIPKTIDRIVDIAEAAGGHIAARKDALVTVKVPSASFRETLTKIDELGGVVSRSVAADDVSEEFHDLEVRLANLRATRQRLQDFMTKATNVNEMLVVERELERIAQEIDRIEGRLEFLRTRAAMSTITVALTAKPKVAPLVTTPASPPPPRTVDLPIPWMSEVGIDKLLTLKK